MKQKGPVQPALFFWLAYRLPEHVKLHNAPAAFGRVVPIALISDSLGIFFDLKLWIMGLERWKL